MRDIKNNLDGVSSMDPASYTATTNGSGVDLRDYDGAMVVFQAGTTDTGSGNETYTPPATPPSPHPIWRAPCRT